MAEAAEIEKYRDFAARTYETFHREIAGALAQTPQGGSVLVAIGEGHGGPDEDAINKNFPDEKLSAVKSAFSHISALLAAVKQLGAENVVCSVEMDQETLKFWQNILKNDSKENGGVLDNHFVTFPMFQAIHFAQQAGIKLVGSDMKDADYRILGFQEEREQTLIRNILSASNQAELGPKKVVVHVGGANHLSDMMGYTALEMIETGGHVAMHGERNPFLSKYPVSLYFSTIHFSDTILDQIRKTAESPDEDPMKRIKALLDLAENTFQTNPQNAIQIYGPHGIVPTEVAQQISQLVIDAALANQGQERKIEIKPIPPQPAAVQQNKPQ